MRISALISVLFLLSLSSEVKAQREAAHWFFGKTAGLDFNGGTPVPETGSLQTLEGSATISDHNGNLLFYTDGITVYDRRHNPMPNGYALKGNVSSTQSAIIVPKPASPGIYYIFTVDLPDYSRDEDDPIEGVNYSIVDMSRNSGLGDVVPEQKNIHLVTYDPSDPVENEYKSSEKISAVLHADGSSYWVITQFVDRFYSFKVTAAGVESAPVISQTPNSVPPVINEQGINITAIGYLKISPNGKKLAVAYSSTRLGSDRTGNKKSGKVFLYDFDDLTGRVSNEQLLLTDGYPYGIEFSPKDTKLYVTSNIYNNQDVMERGDVYQYDLESTNILNSRFTLHSSNSVAGALQLAIDGRIYRAGYPVFAQSHTRLSVIRNPEAAGEAAGYRHDVIDLSPRVVQLGLPPFIQSLFVNNFSFENLCYGDETRFFMTSDEPYTSISWDFGDGNTGTGEDVTHVYSAPGTYIVSFTRYLNGQPFEPARKEITIVEVPEITDQVELIQCDTDENSTDGYATFNLQEARGAVTAGSSATQVFFYESRSAAENDDLNVNALADIYRNTSTEQVVFAKVVAFNSGCSSITEVVLKTKSSIELAPSPAMGCDMGDGEVQYDLETVEAGIKDELNLDDDIELSFYLTEEDALIGRNPLPDMYLSQPGTIYIRAQSEGICYGAGSIALESTSFPSIAGDITIEACTSSFPLTLGTDLEFQDGETYRYEWNTGETSREINVTTAGTYTVEVINAAIGCGRTVEYFIEELVTPEILEVVENSNGETSEITVISSSETGNLYAIDDREGPYQQEPVFNNIQPGPHTIFMKNETGCTIRQYEIVVFGFPDFFTPNNDGFNDRWRPVKITDPDYQILTLLIFDRYGKLVKQLDPNGSGWDGTLNGIPLPQDDYWFKANLVNGRQFSGHFTLKR